MKNDVSFVIISISKKVDYLKLYLYPHLVSKRLLELIYFHFKS